MPSHLPVYRIRRCPSTCLRACLDGTDFDIILQLHFALQAASQWREVYDGFNYKAFYWFLVDYLEGGSADVEELLDWWNE